MRKTLLISAALLLQIAVPGWMILDREITLLTGTEIKFSVHTINPADAFGDSYVTLGFATDLTLTVQSEDHTFQKMEPTPGWVLYRMEGGKAVAAIKAVREPDFSDEGVWIKASVRPNHISGIERVNIELPFGSFYMNEKIAPETERLFQGRKWKNVEAVVRVRNGKAVLVDVLADGKPIAQAVRELSAKPKTP